MLSFTFYHISIVSLSLQSTEDVNTLSFDDMPSLTFYHSSILCVYLQSMLDMKDCMQYSVD